VHLTGRFVGWVHDETGAFFNDGKPYEIIATCTGFGVHPDGYVATAGHCVDTSTDDGIRASFIEAAAEEFVATVPGQALPDVVAYGMANWTVAGQAAGSPIESEVRASGMTTGGSPGVPARVLDVRPFAEGDVALLKIEAAHLPALELVTAADIAVGTSVLSGGFPASVGEVVGPNAQPSIKDGEISGRQSVDSGPVYEISAALTPGMSGGPTVDLAGRVLGVNSFIPAEETQAFNFVVPASGLAELLGRNGVRNELGSSDLLYRKGLNAYFAGHYTDAIVAFDQLLAEVPTHPRAMQLRADAVAARERFGDASAPDPSVLGYVGAAVAGVVLMSVAVLLLILWFRRRRRQRQSMRMAPQLRVEMPYPGWPAGVRRPVPAQPVPPPPGPMAPAGPRHLLPSCHATGGAARVPVGPPANQRSWARNGRPDDGATEAVEAPPTPARSVREQTTVTIARPAPRALPVRSGP
jgi:hypothetical protein